MKKKVIKKEPIIKFEKRETGSKISNSKNKPKKRDIIIKKAKKTIEYKEGCEIHKTTYENVNITKKVNETKKLIQGLTAEQKIQELEKLFTGDKKK